MTVIGILIGGPIGMLAGTYLAEYGRTARISSVIRFVNDVLLSAPSIIIGLFVYELLVVRMGHFSAIAGAVALAIIAMPVTVRTTEDMLNLVPQGMKDASTAMGAYTWRTVTNVIYPAARSGIVTGTAAGGGAHQRRDRAAAVHRAQQPVLEQQPRCTDGEPAGGHLPVRAQSLSELAAAGLVGGAASSPSAS